MSSDLRDERMTEEKEYRTCRRCGRPFTTTKPDQEYGEKCLRKMAGQTMLLDRYVVPPRKKRRKRAVMEAVADDIVEMLGKAAIV